jgi:hypothetical protein
MPLDRNTIDEPYELMVCRQRCGNSIADALMPTMLILDMLELMASLEARQTTINEAVDAMNGAGGPLVAPEPV